mgnify:CR=1 FL=1|tara:strand:- start:207 stop:950 length:744 start_codon:yes stop_codon:yes gene_type:complete
MSPTRKSSQFKAADIRALAAQYKLKVKTKRSSLTERLRSSAEVYFANKEEIDSIEPNQDVREQLKALSKAIQKLQTHRKGLSLAATSALRKAEKIYERDATYISIGMDKISIPQIQTVSFDDNLKFIRVTMSADEWSDITFNQKMISDALTHLEAFSKAAQKNLMTRTKGRRNSMSLRLWVRNIAGIWRDHRGEPFHVTYLAGNPKSEAACFCADTLKIIDPGIPKSKVITEMRKFVTEEKTKNLKK